VSIVESVDLNYAIMEIVPNAILVSIVMVGIGITSSLGMRMIDEKIKKLCRHNEY